MIIGSRSATARCSLLSLPITFDHSIHHHHRRRRRRRRYRLFAELFPLLLSTLLSPLLARSIRPRVMDDAIGPLRSLGRCALKGGETVAAHTHARALVDFLVLGSRRHRRSRIALRRIGLRGDGLRVCKSFRAVLIVSVAESTPLSSL